MAQLVPPSYLERDIRQYWRQGELTIVKDRLPDLNIVTTQYNVSKVVNADYSFNLEKYEEYSPMYLPIVSDYL